MSATVQVSGCQGVSPGIPQHPAATLPEDRRPIPQPMILDSLVEALVEKELRNLKILGIELHRAGYEKLAVELDRGLPVQSLFGLPVSVNPKLRPGRFRIIVQSRGKD